jgi:hypothetical protein
MRYAVGTFARERGAELPHRLVSSAKSWLCNPSIDRTAQVLPFRGAQRELEKEMEGGERVSPVNASARYLAHLRAAWDDANPDEPAGEQEVLVTVPASFDPVARELTVVAAREAGFDKVTLLEEPQAAFYAYLAAKGDAWRKELSPGDVVLVCDVGGGTTDFTLIEVAREDGSCSGDRRRRSSCSAATTWTCARRDRGKQITEAQDARCDAAARADPSVPAREGAAARREAAEERADHDPVARQQARRRDDQDRAHARARDAVHPRRLLPRRRRYRRLAEAPHDGPARDGPALRARSRDHAPPRRVHRPVRPHADTRPVQRRRDEGSAAAGAHHGAALHVGKP